MIDQRPRSSTLVERLSGRVANRIGRRGFLARTAILGSALAVAPTDMLLRPTTAYAAVCSCVGAGCACGALCCDGYTEFCCSIFGPNRCPPGTAVAGWWKADGSGFCGGPRYYMDCNAGCDGCGCDGTGLCSGACSGTGCGCANGNCNERRAGCNEFRYGQCNQEIPCLGPIVCRLVTCIPPWEIEATCTTAPATDQSTAGHDAPCLHVPIGANVSVTSVRQTVTLTGWALDNDYVGPIQVAVYLDGAYLTQLLANGPAPDGVFAHIGHGFTAVLNGMTPGTHTICTYALNTAFGTVNPLLGCPVVAVSDNPYGNFEGTHSGLDEVTVTGWAIDPDTANPITVAFTIDGVAAGQTLANTNRPDVANAYPGHGADHGFATTLPVTAGTHTICATAINTATGTANTPIGCHTTTIGGNPYGNFEAAVAGPAEVTLTGWAIDPDTPNPITVAFTIDGVAAGQTLANTNRPDVANAYPDYGPDHGFATTLPVTTGTHTICATAINTATGTANTPIGCHTTTIGGNPYGNFEAAVAGPAEVTLTGWAIDPDTANPITVAFTIDGVAAGQTLANTNRPDVANAYPDYGPDHGFATTLPVTTGTHTICATAINTATGTANTPIGCHTTTISGNPYGNFEAAVAGPAEVTLTGWAIDPDTANPITVAFTIDGVAAGQTLANTNRPDVANAYPDYGPDHGFATTLPVTTGTHTICATAINTATGTANTPIGCHTTTIST